jgi:hypothetical protein
MLSSTQLFSFTAMGAFSYKQVKGIQTKGTYFDKMRLPSKGVALDQSDRNEGQKMHKKARR